VKEPEKSGGVEFAAEDARDADRVAVGIFVGPDLEPGRPLRV
jgi:hypothetical protein